MTLSQKQRRFAYLVAKLIEWAYAKGYEVTLGEAFRPPETAQMYAKQGKGIVHSLHTIRLAIDLNLFKDGEYLTRSEDYLPLGAYWESLDEDCRWGGRFTHPDGNHFSIEHEGRQ